MHLVLWGRGHLGGAAGLKGGVPGVGAAYDVMLQGGGGGGGHLGGAAGLKGGVWAAYGVMIQGGGGSHLGGAAGLKGGVPGGGILVGLLGWKVEYLGGGGGGGILVGLLGMWSTQVSDGI